MRRLNVIRSLLLLAAMIWASQSAALAQPTGQSPQSRTQILIELQKRLDNPDPAVRYPGYEAALGSSDPVVRSLALSKAFASTDPVVRNLALGSVFQRIKTLSFEIAPIDEVAKEIQAKRDSNDVQISREAEESWEFIQRFGAAVTFLVLQYDAANQSLVGISSFYPIEQKLDADRLSKGSLSGETLSVSLKLPQSGCPTCVATLCTIRLTLGQGGVMSGPISCAGHNTLRRGKAQLRLM